MKTSTPNLNGDLTGLSGVIELADSILQNGAPLHPNFHIDIHHDVLMRYWAARAGKVFDPSDLDALYENGVARRRREFKKESVSLDVARDIYRVVSRLSDTGDLVGSDQLPRTPLKQIPPITVVNNLVRGWAQDLGIQDTPHDEFAQIEKLEAIANLLLHEAHPESQNMTTPRRRKLDLPMEEPLLIHTLGRIRDLQDQIENVEICDVRDLDFAITKSAVGAYITLANQHGLAPSVEGLSELYRRGLLPLSILMKNDAVIKQIALITGREKQELCEAIVRVEETHSVHRALHLRKLIVEHDRHLDSIREQKDARQAQLVAKTNAAKNRPNGPAISQSSQAKLEHNFPSPVQKAEIDALHLVRASAVLGEDSSWMVNHLLQDVLGHPETILPNMDGFAANISELEELLEFNLEPTNIWFTSAYLKGIQEKIPLVNGAPGLPENLTNKNAPESITSFLIIAREVDIFIESMLAHSTLRSLLLHWDRSAEFVKAVKSFGQVISNLDRLHENSIEALRDILHLRADICDTNRAWRKIAHNPLLNRDPSPEHPVVELTDQEARIASLIHHLPLPVTKVLYTNRYVGMVWDQTRETLEDRIKEVCHLDRRGNVIEEAESLRHSLSTAGIETVYRGYPFRLTISNPKGFAEFVKPVAQRYEGIDTQAIARPTIGR